MTNHTLEKTQWLMVTSLTFGNSIKIDSFSGHTPEVKPSSTAPKLQILHLFKAHVSITAMGGWTTGDT